MEPAALSISVIDDDASVLRAVRRLLRAAGFAVQTFESAEEFLEVGAQANPDCLVLDVHLGGLSGFDLEARLAASGRMIPIVFITAHDQPAGLKGMRPGGTAECLRKPFDDQWLIDAIHRVTSRGSDRAVP